VARNGTCTGGNRLHMVTGKSGCLGGISLVKGIGNVKSCSHRLGHASQQVSVKGGWQCQVMFASFESCESARYIGHVGQSGSSRDRAGEEKAGMMWQGINGSRVKNRS